MSFAERAVLLVLTAYGIGTAISVLKAGQVLVQKPMDWLSRQVGFGWVRLPLALVRCTACMAFWAGFLMSHLNISVIHPAVMAPLGAALLDGFFAAGGAWLLHVLAERLSYGLDL